MGNRLGTALFGDNDDDNERAHHHANGFDTFMIGTLPAPFLLPTCEDELLDWTEKANFVFPRGDKLLMMNNDDDDKDPTPPDYDSILKDGLRITAYVRDGRGRRLNTLPSKPWLDRAKFLCDHICLAIENRRTDRQINIVSGILFSKSYSLICRLYDLLEIQDHSSRRNSLNDSEKTTTTKHCFICQNHLESQVLACCSHGMCHNCEKAWVRKELSCPYCRERFKNIHQVGQWELTDWNDDNDQVVHDDIASLRRKLIYMLLNHDNDDDDLKGFVPLERNIKNVYYDGDAAVIVQ